MLPAPRLAIADDEFFQAHGPVAADRRQIHLRIEGQKRRHAIGRRGRVADIAGDGSRVLDLHAAHLPRREFESVNVRRKGRLDDIRPGGGCADAIMIVGFLDATQPLDAGNVQH